MYYVTERFHFILFQSHASQQLLLIFTIKLKNSNIAHTSCHEFRHLSKIGDGIPEFGNCQLQ